MPKFTCDELLEFSERLLAAGGIPAADARLVTKHWNDEDEWVIFSPLSGDVHLLNSAAYQLLEALAEGPPMSAEALVAHLAGLAGRTPDAELEAAVATALTTLDSAGLIEPSRP